MIHTLSFLHLDEKRLRAFTQRIEACTVWLRGQPGHVKWLLRKNNFLEYPADVAEDGGNDKDFCVYTRLVRQAIEENQLSAMQAGSGRTLSANGPKWVGAG